jgi:hypothetical protein
VHFRESEATWRPHSLLKLSIEMDKISVVRDYVHVDYLLSHSHVD